MPTSSVLPILLRLAFVFVLLSQAAVADADKSITLAAGERIPYAGNSLPNKGYAAELVTTALARQGYRVNIEFYPWARAQKLAQEGEVNGVLPVFRDVVALRNGTLIYSMPFPGDTIGLLKKKSFRFSYAPADIENKNALAAALKGRRIGVVRSGASLPFLEDIKLIDQQPVNNDIQNLDKLALGRIDLALIDKYTAADLTVGYRPHLIGHFEFLEPPLAQRDFFVGFSTRAADYRRLVDAFNKGLDEIGRDGTLRRILEKHGFFVPRKTEPGKTRLIIGTVNNSDMKMVRQLSKEFDRAHPNIDLEWRVLDENTLRLRLLSDLAIADSQFDVMTIGTYEAPLWAKQKWLMPLVPAPNYDIEDVLPTVRAGFSYNGQLFALPFYAESSMMFYRKDLFAKAGLTMPPAPSYDDVKKFAAKIHNPAAGVYGVCLRGKAGWGENMAFLTTMVNAFGGRWFDERWRPELDSPEWEKAITFYKDLLQQYGPPHADANGFNENLKLFSEGHCGMWIDATVAAGMLFDPKRSTVSANLGYVQAPMMVTKKGAAWLWGWGLAVPNSSKHKQEALEFIAWATSKNYIKEVAQNYGWVAAPPATRKSTYENANYRKAAPFAQFVLNAVESADIKNSTLKPKPYLGIQYVGIPEFPAIGHQVGTEIAKALRGEQLVKEALAKSQATALEQMKNSGYIQ